MISHQLVLAASDERFHGRHYRVLIYLHTRLDWIEYRAVKLNVVGRVVRLDKSAVSRMVDDLDGWEYLHVGPKDGRIHTYRLRMPPPIVVPGATFRAA